MEAKIRRAETKDVPEISRLAVELCDQHQKYDSLRFYFFDNLETRLAALFTEEIADPNAAVLVAENDGQIVGYAFVRREAENLIQLADARTWLHDIYISGSARGRGIGKKLLEASITTARSMGSSVLMLQAAEKNKFAQTLFSQHNFRATMREMMLDLS